MLKIIINKMNQQQQQKQEFNKDIDSINNYK
jgi:hypothetical protein